MPKTLSPIASEFETASQARRHDAWVRKQVTDSLADTTPVTPHDAVMADMEAIIAEAEQARGRTR